MTGVTAAGLFSIYSMAGPNQVVVDLFGYFV
jgi:hypothetical protein